MSDDAQQPKTYRSTACYDALVASFSGPILDGATKHEAKSDVPENELAYSVVAPQDGSADYGILINVFPQQIASHCAGGSISTSQVLGKVRL